MATRFVFNYQNGTNVSHLPPELYSLEWTLPKDAVKQGFPVDVVTMASVPQPNAETDEGNEIVVIGHGVIELALTAGLVTNTGPQIDCQLCGVLGGIPVNVARQARSLGADVGLIAMVGDDEESLLAARLIRGEFDDRMALVGSTAAVEPLLVRTQIAIGSEDRQQIPFPILASHRLAESSWRRWSSARWAFLGQLTKADFDFASACLLKNRNTILQLSADQLSDQRTIELMQLAWLTILDRGQLCQLTNGITDAEGIRWLRDRGVQSVLLTSDVGVFGFHQDWLWQSAPVPDRAKTSATEGRFIGTMLAALADGEIIHEAIRRAANNRIAVIEAAREVRNPGGSTIYGKHLV